VVFSLNDEKFFKSQTKRKTLAPEWNETCMVQVPSRVGSDFVAEVFDWNQIDKAKSLGLAKIDLASLEPFRGIEQTLHLSDEKHGNTGRIRVVLTFQPEIIAKSRKKTSTFSTAGRAMTQLGTAPFTGAKGVVHGVGSVGAKATGLFRKDHAKNVPSVASVPEVPEAGQISQPVQQNLPPTNFPTHGGNSMSSGAIGEPGVLKVTVFTAKDLSISGDIKPYIVLRVGDKENKTKHHSKGPAPEWFVDPFRVTAITDICLGTKPLLSLPVQKQAN
jgi:Ca2+-dependent lipid-binding protein